MKDCGTNDPGTVQLSQILQDSLESPVQSKQEREDVGAGSGYGRDRQARWDAKELRTATTKVRREVYEEFRKLCQEQGQTPYSVLQDLLKTWIRKQAVLKELRQPSGTWTGWHSSGGGGRAQE